MTDSNDPTDAEPAGLIGADEPPAVELIRANTALPALLVCDHASARVPAALGRLGLEEAAFREHIALDIGAASVTRRLSAMLELPAVMTGYSRLVVDCNRGLSDATAFPAEADGRVVAGNQSLDEVARRVRAEACYWPYHRAIEAELAELGRQVEAPALIAIHSFTPTLNGHARPWHCGVLWDKDPRIPQPLMVALDALPDIVVGDNEPYSGRHPADFTIDHHGEANGLPHISIELRQDLIDSDEGANRWAGLLAETLLPILRDPSLYRHWVGA